MVTQKSVSRKWNYKEQIGSFVVPKCKTLDELLKEYVDLYGKDKWALSTYSSNVALIKNYVSPKIGTMKISDINTRVIERYYQSLLKTEAVPRIGQKTPKKYVTPHTVKDFLRFCAVASIRQSNGSLAKIPLPMRLCPSGKCQAGHMDSGNAFRRTSCVR